MEELQIVNRYFIEIGSIEAVQVVGGVDQALKKLLYDLAFIIGKLIKAIFGNHKPQIA